MIENGTDVQADLRSAKIIQQGLLPKDRHFKRLFDDYFVFYLPQNIISGDFYWVGEKNGLKYVVVGDCTGHGVSAALLSVMAISLFEYVIMNKGVKKVNRILQEVDKRFIESFKDAERGNFDNPWIDLSVICIDADKKQLFYGGANRKMLYLKDGKEQVVVKGKRYPVGGWQLAAKRHFETTTISYSEGDVIYIGTDGFQDQIGGEKQKKYKSNRLHSFLNEICMKSFENQEALLDDEHKKWKGENDQVDDICLIGLKL